jgi:hypothetical protein
MTSNSKAKPRLSGRMLPIMHSDAAGIDIGGAGSIPKGPLDAGVTEKIASCRSDLGPTLYEDILQRVARVRSPRDVADQKLQHMVLRSMEICLRAIRENATELPEGEFYTILDDLGVQSLDRIPSFEAFQKLANAMHAANPNRRGTPNGVPSFEVNHAHHPVFDLSCWVGTKNRQSRPGGLRDPLLPCKY